MSTSRAPKPWGDDLTHFPSSAPDGCHFGPFDDPPLGRMPQKLIQFAEHVLRPPRPAHATSPASLLLPRGGHVLTLNRRPMRRAFRRNFFRVNGRNGTNPLRVFACGQSF
jgi:hypothetical protein